MARCCVFAGPAEYGGVRRGESPVGASGSGMATNILFPLCRLRRKSDRYKKEICFFVSWYTLPHTRNFKPLIEFKTL